MLLMLQSLIGRLRVPPFLKTDDDDTDLCRCTACGGDDDRVPIHDCNAAV